MTSKLFRIFILAAIMVPFVARANERAAANRSSRWLDSSTNATLKLYPKTSVTMPTVYNVKAGNGVVHAYDIVRSEALTGASCKQCSNFGNGHVLLDVREPGEPTGVFIKGASNIHARQANTTTTILKDDSGTITFDWEPMTGHTIVFSNSLTPKARLAVQVGLLASSATAAYVYRNEIKAGAKKAANAVGKLIKKASGSVNAPIKSKL